MGAHLNSLRLSCNVAYTSIAIASWSRGRAQSDPDAIIVVDGTSCRH
jgi:hypothetical protein